MARLPATGSWRAVLTVGNEQAERLTAELPLEATADGPSAVYLGFMGFLIGGSMLYGAIQRLRGARRRLS
jgi:hypothetical protein